MPRETCVCVERLTTKLTGAAEAAHKTRTLASRGSARVEREVRRARLFDGSPKTALNVLINIV